MSIEQLLSDYGYDESDMNEIVTFSNPSYEDAVIGITTDMRLIYDYDRMVEWCITNEDMTEEQAVEWIDYNTIRSLGYIENAPLIMYKLK